MHLFQLHMGISFPSLRSKDLRTSLLIMITRSFLSPVKKGVHTQGHCTLG